MANWGFGEQVQGAQAVPDVVPYFNRSLINCQADLETESNMDPIYLSASKIKNFVKQNCASGAIS